MSLFIHPSDFKKIAQYELENFYDSYIDFEQQEWQFIQGMNPHNDVEISYLFQFDYAESREFFEIFHKGMTEEFIQRNILNVILSEFPNFNYHFE